MTANFVRFVFKIRLDTLYDIYIKLKIVSWHSESPLISLLSRKRKNAEMSLKFHSKFFLILGSAWGRLDMVLL